MSIAFNCPNCGSFIAFADQHAGKRARCTSCQQRFLIPDERFNAPQVIVDPKATNRFEAPLPGFYRAVFMTSWVALFRLRSVAALVFVIAAVSFKFFTAHVDYSFTMGAFRCQMYLGLIIRTLVWGALFWYYLELINSTTQNDDTLPDIDFDGGFDFLGKAIKSMFVFFLALLICLLPTLLYIRGSGHQESLTATLLMNLGLFFLPMLLLAIGMTQDIQIIWRVDTMLTPMIKTFFPYLTCALMIMLAWNLQMHTHNYGDESLKGTTLMVKSLYLAGQVGIQLLTLVAMRALGLLYRHYACYFSW